MHGASLAVSNTFSATEQFANDGFDGSAAHESEAVAAVGGDDVVFFGEGVFDTDGNGFLSGGEMAETADFLLLVESVGGHFHTTEIQSRVSRCSIGAWKLQRRKGTHRTETMS